MDITPAELFAECDRFLAEHPWVWAVEIVYRLPRGVLLSLGSRETNLTNELGDGGHGHGVWQLDDRSHVIPAGFDGDVQAQADTAAAMFQGLLHTFGGNVVAAACAYNAGAGAVGAALAAGRNPNSVTTGGDYGDDVLGRLTAIAAHYPPGGSVNDLARPAIAICVRPQRDGYWIVCQDGGVFAFGAAPALTLKTKPPAGHLIIDAEVWPDGEGLILVGSDGGVFDLGSAVFHGSIPGLGLGPSPQSLST